MLPLYGFGFGPARFLYPFLDFDPVRRKWVRARYVAEASVIAARYERWEIIGPAEVRRAGTAEAFSPWR
jgi:hypothetical protein